MKPRIIRSKGPNRVVKKKVGARLVSVSKRLRLSPAGKAEKLRDLAEHVDDGAHCTITRRREVGRLVIYSIVIRFRASE